jgi:PAS domain S-box-containing protein
MQKSEKDDRVEKILEQIRRYAAGDFTPVFASSGNSDGVEDIGNSLNALGETLKSNSTRVNENEVENIKKYRNLFESNPTPMWVLELPSLRFLDVNESALRQYGYSRAEFLSMTAVEIRPDEEKEKFINVDRSGERPKEPHKMGIWKHKTKDGSIIFAEVVFHAMMYDGKPCGLVLSNDVTERINAEQALRDSEARFRKIFDSGMIGFVFCDTDGKILDANDFFLHHIGYTRDELRNGSLNWVDLTPREFFYVDRIMRDQLAERGITDPFEKEYFHKDGTRLPVLVRVASLDDHEPTTGVAYVMDIRQQKRMEKEIQQLNKDLEEKIVNRTAQLLAANKELESFSYTVSHDLRAPLRAIIGYAQMLLEDYREKLDGEAIRLINTVTYNAKRMGQLVDELLEFSRMGKKDLNKTQCDLTQIANNVVKDLGSHIEINPQIRVNPLGFANADPALIQNVFQNLLSNAIKYSSKKEKPVIEVGKIEANGETAYFVQDNGAGFDMSYYNKLFGVFHRLHRQDVFEGTGVGLAIVQRILERHGGKIWAESKLGEGSTFFFTLG